VSCGDQSLVADDVLSELCYQYRCGWDTGVGFIHLIRTQRQTTYFCVNLPPKAMERLKAAVQKMPHVVYRDLFLDALVANESLRRWQFEIGHRRSTLQTFVRCYSPFE
jgi:hypothetical protein